MRRQLNTNYGYVPDEDYGFIPEELVPEDAAEFDAMTGKYDPAGQPAIVSWESFEPFVKERADEVDKMRAAGWNVLWWKIAKHCGVPLWSSNQGNLGSCAGWSAANGHMVSVIYQMMLGAFRFTLINPLAMWAQTKNWSTSGGQSMSNVLMGGNKFGNYPVANVGAYSTNLSRETRSKIEAAANVAKLHQFGACRLPGIRTNLAAAIVLCLRAGLVVCIGNSVRVSGSKIDGNGMRVATLGGGWSHATLLDGYAVVNGTVYVHWTNSHGDRYKGSDKFDSPESGCWMPLSTLEQFCSGRYTDAFCIYRAEATVDTARNDFTPATVNSLVA
jgi:hypothetical protein